MYFFVLLFLTIDLCLCFFFSSVLGPTLDLVSLTEASISKEKDLDKQNIFHLAQMAIFIHYGAQTKHDLWFPYLKILMNNIEK